MPHCPDVCIAASYSNIALLSTLPRLCVTRQKGDGILLGQKIPGGPTPMYGHGLNLNEQWVSMLEKVRGVLTWLPFIRAPLINVG